MENLINRIRLRIAEDLGISVEQVRDDSRFEEDLNADSLQTTNIMLLAENESGKTIPDEARENIHTLAELNTFLIG